MEYRPRIVDAELDTLLEGLPAVSLEGPKAVGKTETALRRARTVHRLDDPARLEIVRGAPARLTAGDPPSWSTNGSVCRHPGISYGGPLTASPAQRGSC